MPSISAGVGVVTSQSFANLLDGYEPLRLLRSRPEPQAILVKLLSQDPGAVMQQVALLDSPRRIVVHMCPRCVSAAGHANGADCCTQANMRVRDAVWQATVHAFKNTEGEISDRMLAGMEVPNWREVICGANRRQRSSWFRASRPVSLNWIVSPICAWMIIPTLLAKYNTHVPISTPAKRSRKCSHMISRDLWWISMSAARGIRTSPNSSSAGCWFCSRLSKSMGRARHCIEHTPFKLDEASSYCALQIPERYQSPAKCSNHL